MRYNEKMKAYSFVGVTVGLFSIIIFLLAQEETRETLLMFITSTEEMGLRGILMFIAAEVVMMLLCCPVTVIELAFGYLYPPFTAAAMAMVARTAGITLAFFISRFFMQTFMAQWQRENKFLKGLQKCVNRDQTKLSFMVQLILIPMFIKIYGMPCFNISFFPYLLASLLASAPYCVLNGILGGASGNLVDMVSGSSEESATATSAATIVSIVAGLIFITYMTYLTRKVKQEITAEAESDEEMGVLSSSHKEADPEMCYSSGDEDIMVASNRR
eukprot:CAMPEP_0115016260 /NCGR_PEP_ID=MMETSP0216-20121206/27318_1 /TAXON_ID=223996 /ORGANISM="Protocruzia adherens, Strain Boccale" /LENGTH=272 /DNA_ID=CAMNT_0002386657 /DNA_START=110 /DNA_END=928 /DNA_ORIENTATION=-